MRFLVVLSLITMFAAFALADDTSLSSSYKFKQATRSQIVRDNKRSPTRLKRGAPSPTAAPATITVNGIPYNLYYSGSGYTENDSNPGNDSADYPPVQTTYPGATSQSSALSQCASFAEGSDNDYFSFQTYYLDDQDIWVCRAYYDPYGSASDFNVVNAQANPVFGYHAE